MTNQARITSLERWGMRAAHDFQPQACAYVKEAGYTGVMVNGGSGIGPDMLTPESLLETASMPDLMPLTARAHRRELSRRCGLLREAGLAPWLCVWGVSGPDLSSGGEPAESNRFFDRRSKLEMMAKLRRSPELFGSRRPEILSWRGSRPLCISHPQVQAFYRELYAGLAREHPDLGGIFYFPGDAAEPECCDDTCSRCQATGLSAWDRLFAHVNDIYRVIQANRPGLPFYFAVWNQDHPKGQAYIARFMEALDPGIGLAMSISDHAAQRRVSGVMTYSQPWSMFAEPGELFLWVYGAARKQGRPIMVMGEISQSEVWDPACHNVPTPEKTLEFLRRVSRLDGVEAVFDFWGNRAPFLPHANHAAMRAWLGSPAEDVAALLARAAATHYGISGSGDAVRQAAACWAAWERAVADWALCAWGQRLSFAIGRDAARGKLYFPFIPAFLRQNNWGLSQVIGRGPGPDELVRLLERDRLAWLEAARGFDALAGVVERLSPTGAALAKREAANIELAAELIVSVGRAAAAYTAWQERAFTKLRAIVEAEIDARERQLQISGRIGLGGGVNPILVSEDIQNMRLFVSSDEFPDVPDNLFHLTACPYSV